MDGSSSVMGGVGMGKRSETKVAREKENVNEERTRQKGERGQNKKRNDDPWRTRCARMGKAKTKVKCRSSMMMLELKRCKD